MLETKNLVKIYKPKKGVPVRALDGVSLKFPDKGMVFLLGKSGSGKSTLLNLLGGLDKYDGGEIIIKNVSSKDFTQQHFDSYRNTYVGFIFQEYNVLEEFTVGANIALALELQGKKATDEELNRILHEVDLDGYGNRRPNELSGGQKQRVAIARALVKNPKIIMADEPTGALDSVTGRQVFDTLKKLSAEKLVIVVSHDREFAQSYADRIIELADGKVISDTSLEENAAPAPQGISFEGATAKIPLGYHLTEEDRIAINQYIDKLQSGAQIEFQKSSDKRFKPTDSGKIENSDKSPFALIKSKLSLKHAFKIGASGLRHKKFRLVMTIILSCIAFVLFGLVDTFSSYDHITTCANSIYDTEVSYASVSKLTVSEKGYPLSTKMNDADIEKLSKETGISFNGVYSSEPFQFLDNIEIESSSNGYQFYTSYFSGMVEIDRQYLDDSGYSIVAGELPDGGKNEIAISRFMLDAFVKYGYKHAYFTDEGAYDISEKIEIKTAGDIIGKTLMVNMEEYEITAVIDTKFDTSRYQSLMPNGEETDSDSASDQLMDFVLYSEFITAVNNDFTGMMMVGEGFISKYIESWGNVSELSAAEIYLMSDNCYVFPYYGTTLDSVKNQEILWLDGERTELADNEVIISSYTAEANLGAVTYDEFGQMQFDTEMLSADEFTLVYTDYFSGTTDNFEGFKIVGIMLIDPLKSSRLNDAVVFPDKIFNKYYSSSDTVYDTALGIMPRNRGDIRALTEYCYTENDGVKYTINNPVCYELDILNEILDVVSGIFLWIGVGFALFAAVLLSNFIATSISYKKQEIGILRAIGSRGNDVFRIFFAEAFIIAMINFVLSCLGTGAVTFIINLLMRQNVGLLVTVLNFGIRQIGLIFLVSIAVAAIASFLPVKKVASKRPIDAIRNR